MPKTDAMTTADMARASDEAKTVAAKKVEKPVPTQAKADEIREEAVGAEVGAKPTKASKPAEPVADAPYPSQADLDAIKEGRFHNREVKAEDGGANYKTR